MNATRRSRWLFWWLWVVATNIGWFSGIALGMRVAARLPEPEILARSFVAAFVAALFFGAAQACMLRARLPVVRGWFLATLLGWPLGILLARSLLGAADWRLPSLLDASVVAFVAGAVVGLPQAWSLARITDHWVWWPLVSACGWGLLLPGALPGLVLSVLVFREAEDSQPPHADS